MVQDAVVIPFPKSKPELPYFIWIQVLQIDAERKDRQKALEYIPQPVQRKFWLDGIPPSVEAVAQALIAADCPDLFPEVL